MGGTNYTSARGQLEHPYLHPEPISLPGQVFSVQLPSDTSLRIGHTLIKSRISVVDHISFASYGNVSKTNSGCRGIVMFVSKSSNC